MQFQLWCGSSAVRERGRSGQSRGPLWFLEKIRFSHRVHSPSPAGEPAMLIAGIWGWDLHMASKSAVKPCLSRLTPKLPSTTLLYPWYLRHFYEDFMLTSPQKTFYPCFSSFLAFWTFCGEGWCKLNEDRRQKNMQNYDGTESSED